MKGIRIIGVLALVAGLTPFAIAPADAQVPALLVKTNYPGVVVGAGKSTTFDMQVVSSTPRRVDLSVVEIPEGWQATLRGGGSVVTAVFSDEETPPSVELEVRVPTDAPTGDHRVVVRGSSANLVSDLVLVLRVSEEEAAGAVSLEPEFDVLRGASTDTFTFNVTLENNTPEEASFNLATDGPDGWVVDAQPSGETQAAVARVEGGGTQEITVTANPPDNVTAGEYTMVLAVSGGAGQEAQTELGVEVTGNVDMTLTTEDERLNLEAQAGDATDVILVVQNNGTAPLQNVTFTASPPTEWEVTFTTEDGGEAIEAVPPGEAGRATARIVPTGDAVAGDYTVTINATAAEGGSGSLDMRVTVEASRFWLVVGILIILGTFFALRWVFQRYGRR